MEITVEYHHEILTCPYIVLYNMPNVEPAAVVLLQLGDLWIFSFKLRKLQHGAS
jgi:hypothetical protein